MSKNTLKIEIMENCTQNKISFLLSLVFYKLTAWLCSLDLLILFISIDLEAWLAKVSTLPYLLSFFYCFLIIEHPFSYSFQGLYFIYGDSGIHASFNESILDVLRFFVLWTLETSIIYYWLEVFNCLWLLNALLLSFWFISFKCDKLLIYFEKL